MRPISRAKYSSTASSVPSWVTAVNDAPASSAKNTLEVIARWPDDDTGRNSVSPCTIERTITCTHDIAGTSVTTTTVPWRSCQRAWRGTGDAADTASRTAADTLRSSLRSMSVSLRVAAATTSSGMRDRPTQPRAVDLDDELLPLDTKGKCSPVADLAKSTGVYTSGNILDSKLVDCPILGPRRGS